MVKIPSLRFVACFFCSQPLSGCSRSWQIRIWLIDSSWVDICLSCYFAVFDETTITKRTVQVLLTPPYQLTYNNNALFNAYTINLISLLCASILSPWNAASRPFWKEKSYFFFMDFVITISFSYGYLWLRSWIYPNCRVLCVYTFEQYNLITRMPDSCPKF